VRCCLLAGVPHSLRRPNVKPVRPLFDGEGSIEGPAPAGAGPRQVLLAQLPPTPARNAAAPPTATHRSNCRSAGRANPIRSLPRGDHRAQHLPTSTAATGLPAAGRPMRARSPPPRWHPSAPGVAGDRTPAEEAHLLQSLQLALNTPAAGDLPARCDHTVWNHFLRPPRTIRGLAIHFKVMVTSARSGRALPPAHGPGR